MRDCDTVSESRLQDTSPTPRPTKTPATSALFWSPTAGAAADAGAGAQWPHWKWGRALGVCWRPISHAPLLPFIPRV